MAATDVLFISLDSCRFDTFAAAHRRRALPGFGAIGPLHKALAPSYFTYGSHSAFWMGFTPGVIGSREPFLNPKAGKLFRMTFAGHAGRDGERSFRLEGANVIDGFRRQGYRTIGSGAVDWFDSSTETGAVLAAPFEHFQFAGNTWSLSTQLAWIDARLAETPDDQPRFVFLNVGETHVPYWHEGASWERWPSPCVPFGSEHCSASESARRQGACLEWIDHQLLSLLQRFSDGTVLVCGDHGDCWGEDGLWEHGISHPATLTVPLLMRVRGKPVGVSSSPSRFRSAASRLKRWLKARL
jgi:hypothetical protein